MRIESIIEQQAFRHGDGKGGMLHSVAFTRSLDDGFDVRVFSCPFGVDGLPDYPKGSYPNPGKQFANLRQASRFFDELVNQQRGRWTFLSPEETLPFALDSSKRTKAPIFEYVPVSDEWDFVRQYLAPQLFEHGVQSFISRLGVRSMRGQRRWTMPLDADFLPIVLHLTIAGFGELQRDGATLTERQLRTVARTVAADPGIDALYRIFGLRDLLPDYGVAIGASATALVL